MTTTAMLGVIERRITELVSSFLAMPDDERLDDVCAAVLHATIRQATVSSEGGKRLRALLAVDTFDALASDDSRRGALIDLACAVEVFQTAALVHDDIIDDADLRRGKPAAHKALAGPAHDAALGTGLGIMLGDLLATASVDIANGAARQLPNADAIIQAFLTMHREVEIGQVLDLAAVQCPMSDPERLAQASLDVFRWKTASYTTIAPLELGMLAAGMSPDEARRHALAIGDPLGLAFQLTDDLLDVVGSSSATGKPIGGDIREGKRTVLLADALTGATPDERRELTAMFEAPMRDETQTARAIALFHTTGAIDHSRDRIETLWTRSLHAIETMGCPTESRTILEQACARFVPSVHYTPREQDSM
ncbi:MAG TPA: polyprenyl synthetase family protein [Bifidobacterium pullorum]|nr:polyprenyl synthetase family protein [Bifidobacterium pullorum]